MRTEISFQVGFFFFLTGLHHFQVQLFEAAFIWKHFKILDNFRTRFKSSMTQFFYLVLNNFIDKVQIIGNSLGAIVFFMGINGFVRFVDGRIIMRTHHFYQAIFYNRHNRGNTKTRHFNGTINGISQTHYWNMKLVIGRLIHLI